MSWLRWWLGHAQPARAGAAACQGCMEIRAERSWCAKCQAPEVWHDNVPLIDLFLDALPAWRMTGMDRAVEGLDRAEVLALMDLRGIAPAERAETWGALAEMEAETRRIRAKTKH